MRPVEIEDLRHAEGERHEHRTDGVLRDIVPVDRLQVIRHLGVRPNLEHLAAVAVEVKPIAADERERQILGGNRVARNDLAAVRQVGREDARRPDERKPGGPPRPGRAHGRHVGPTAILGIHGFFP